MIFASSSVTVTVQEALLSPAFAVTVAVPAATAVTFPPSTVATDASLLDHVTVLSVALPGLTVAVSVADSPIISDSVVLLSVTPVTATIPACLTVTVCDIVPPFCLISTFPSRALPVVFSVTLNRTVELFSAFVSTYWIQSAPLFTSKSTFDSTFTSTSPPPYGMS